MLNRISKSAILPSCIIGLSLLGGVSGTTVAWQHETHKEECVPLAFSEITQIEKKYGSYEYGFPEGFDAEFLKTEEAPQSVGDHTSLQEK